MHRSVIAPALVVFLLSTPALADAKLVTSAPAADATLAAPKVIKLTFSEKIAADSGLQLSMGDGMTVPARTSLSDDGKTLTARPTSPFMAGKWTVSWHTTSASDGGKSQGTYSFTIQ
jgi:methionine-rich copper-binding protein CopC